jgi:hypothetical protein
MKTSRVVMMAMRIANKDRVACHTGVCASCEDSPQRRSRMPTPSPRSPRSHASDTCARLTMRRSTGVSSVSRLTPLEQSAPQLGAPSETLLAEPLLACLKTEASDRVEARGAPQHSVQATPMRSHINRTAISEDCARWHALRPTGSPPAQPCHPASSPS